jgi:hypothetical protein
MYVEKLQTLPMSDYEANFDILQTAVDNLVVLVDVDSEGQEDADNFTPTKWVLRKSILACLLTLNVKEYTPLNFQKFPKRAGDKAAGDDQIEFKKYNSNATASEVNVKGRIAILEKIQRGNFTSNIAGDAKIAKVTLPKTTKVELKPAEVSKKQRLQASMVWNTDDVDFVNTSVGMAIAWCNAYGYVYGQAFETKNFKHEFSYIDKDQKNHFKPIADLASLTEVIVKIKTPEVTAVEPVTIEA